MDNIRKETAESRWRENMLRYLKRHHRHAMRRQERQLYTHIIMKVVASRTLQEYN